MKTSMTASLSILILLSTVSVAPAQTSAARQPPGTSTPPAATPATAMPSAATASVATASAATSTDYRLVAGDKLRIEVYKDTQLEGPRARAERSGGQRRRHTLGNLVLAALADVMNDFPRAVEIAARVVGAHGTVLPATSEVVTLMAEFEDGRVLSGETAISAAGGRIARLSLIPERPRFLPETCEVLARADVVVAGPGSLYTSVLPPLLVPQVHEAIRNSRATRVLVANLMTEPGETDDYSVLEHVLTIERHLGAELFDYVIYNTSPVPGHLAASYGSRGAQPIVTGTFELNALERLGIQPIGVPLVSEHAGKIRHHPDRLAAAIVALGQGKLGAWRGRADAGGL